MIYAHPNRRAFTGVLVRLDEPSDAAPKGARLPGEKKKDSRRVIVTTEAAENAIPTLIGMPLNWSEKLDGHAPTQIGGIITDAMIDEAKLLVSGYVFSKNRLTEVARLDRDDLGMSFEAANTYVCDMREPVWVIRELTFTGATVLKRKSAAYRSTAFTLLPSSADVPVNLASQTDTSLSTCAWRSKPPSAIPCSHAPSEPLLVLSARPQYAP